ncbi:MAG TPA: hypothetical protein VJH22_03715 [Candidatus Nanoarchaeia archaeon]|nr:hypothetical protein [Candidatus Nanoarchaeia archaeon]
MTKKGNHQIAIISIIALLALLAITLLINHSIGNQITGAVHFSEPTFCEYDTTTESTHLECACGRAQSSRSGKALRLADMRGKIAEVNGDWCLLQDQRELCMELCSWSTLALRSKGYVEAPGRHVGTAKILTIEDLGRAVYYPGHSMRAREGAYTYISGR